MTVHTTTTTYYRLVGTGPVGQQWTNENASVIGDIGGGSGPDGLYSDADLDALAGRILDTMQNWRDALQAELHPDSMPGLPQIEVDGELCAFEGRGPVEVVEVVVTDELAVRLTAAAAAHDTDVADLLDTMLDELELAGRPFTVTAANLADRVRYIISRHATLDGAVQALRTVQADDADGVQRGLPSAAPRIEHSGRPVAIDVPMTVRR